MATTSQNIEQIGNNVAAIARESALILENGRSVVTKGVSDFTTAEVISLGKKLQQNESSIFDYKKYLSASSIFYLNGDMTGMSKENKKDMTFKYNGIEGTCTCKWQGNYSLRWPKKNFSIAKMSNEVDAGWGAQKKYVLKAEYEDPSFVRNVGCAELWGQIIQNKTSTDAITTALKSAPNGGAIDGFPIVLIINNSFHGLYSMNIPKDQWMMGMGDGNLECILTADNGGEQATFNKKMTKQNLLDEVGFQVEYATDEDDVDWIVSSLQELYDLVNNNQSNSNFRSVLEQKLDCSTVIDLYIMYCLIGHWDGVTHNWLLSTFNGQKWFVSPYDMDKTLWYHNDLPTFANFASRSKLMKLFYTHDKSALKARYYELRNSIFSESNFQKTLYAYVRKIHKELILANNRFWPGSTKFSFDPMVDVLNCYRLRCEYLDKEVESWNV